MYTQTRNQRCTSFDWNLESINTSRKKENSNSEMRPNPMNSLVELGNKTERNQTQHSNVPILYTSTQNCRSIHPQLNEFTVSASMYACSVLSCAMCGDGISEPVELCVPMLLLTHAWLCFRNSNEPESRAIPGTIRAKSRKWLPLNIALIERR